MNTLAALLTVSVMVLLCEGCGRRDPPPPPKPADKKFPSPAGGTYVFAIPIDPYQKDVGVELWYQGRSQRALYGVAVQAIMNILDVALPMKGGQTMVIKTSEFQQRDHSFTVVLTNRDYTFVTALSRGYDKGSGAIPFHTLIDRSGYPQSTRSPQTSFKVPKTGVYWVAIRADCEYHKEAKIGLMSHNFYAYCENDHAITESAALYFWEDDTVQVKYLAGNSRLQSMTMLSFSLLEGNKIIYKTYTARGNRTVNSFVAYTAYAKISTDPVVQFDHQFVTNYGHLWQERHHIFYRMHNNAPRRMGNFRGVVTHVRGIYLVSTAGIENHSFTFQLYDVNMVTNKRTLLHTFHHEHMFRTGMTRAFLFGVQALEIRKSDRSTRHLNNRFSIALVYRK